jgi:UDP-glucuronate decarboxylase
MESPEGVTGPVNLGNSDEFTVNELAEIIIEMTGSRSPIEYRDLPEDDPRQRQPDIQQAAKLLDWRPSITLREGLARTINYFEQRLQKSEA